VQVPNWRPSQNEAMAEERRRRFTAVWMGMGTAAKGLRLDGSDGSDMVGLDCGWTLTGEREWDDVV